MSSLRLLPAARPCARRPRPVRRAACRVAASPTITAGTHVLPDGTPLELLSINGDAAAARPPLLLVHGSGHAAWCWADKFMPALADRGWDAHAVSLRGRGRSGPPPPGAKAGGTLASHAADIASVATSLRRPPIIVGHSFGGLLVQRLLVDAAALPAALPGVALLASAPPSGNGAMVARIARDRGLVLSAKLTWGFVTRAYAKSAAACRMMFFSDGPAALPDADIERYVRLLAENDGATPVLDVRSLGKETPLPAAPAPRPPGFVLGGDADTIVDVAALEEAAEWLGASQPTVLPGSGHDVMLDVGWERAVDALSEWGASVC